MIVRQLFRYGLIFAGLSVLSYSAALDLTVALTAVGSRTGVINSSLAASDARLALTRTQADPLALRLEQTQAAQRLALAEAQLRQARYTATADIAATYMQVLEAEAQLELARFARDLAAQSLEITRIRLERGSATELEVEEAQNTLQEAEQTVTTAEQGTQLAKRSLESLIGQEVIALEPVSEAYLRAVPSLETVLAGLKNHPTLLEATQGVELATIGRDLLDPSYAAQVQIDAAELQLEQAETFTAEARRGLQLQARSLYNQVQTAAASYRIQQDALRNARAREALEAQRLEAGLIADITFRQTQLATKQAELAAMQGKHNYLNALLELQAGTLIPLEGLHEF